MSPVLMYGTIRRLRQQLKRSQKQVKVLRDRLDAEIKSKNKLAMTVVETASSQPKGSFKDMVLLDDIKLDVPNIDPEKVYDVFKIPVGKMPKKYRLDKAKDPETMIDYFVRVAQCPEFGPLFVFNDVIVAGQEPINNTPRYYIFF
jgi:hypothetical protein